MTDIEGNTIRTTVESSAVEDLRDNPLYDVEVIESIGDDPKLCEITVIAVPIAEMEALIRQWRELRGPLSGSYRSAADELETIIKNYE